MCQTIAVPDDRIPEASERADARRAGQVAVAAAVLGLVAVVAILMSVNREEAVEASRGLSSDDETVVSSPEARRIGPESRTETSASSGAAPPPFILTLPSATPTAARGASGPVDDGGRGDAGMEVAELGIEPVIVPARAELDHPLTPEERYEANAFVLDVLTVRADIVREELAAAREAGRPVLVRRLERNLAALERESERLAAQGREMERGLGLPGTSGDEPK